MFDCSRTAFESCNRRRYVRFCHTHDTNQLVGLRCVHPLPSLLVPCRAPSCSFQFGLRLLPELRLPLLIRELRLLPPSVVRCAGLHGLCNVPFLWPRALWQRLRRLDARRRPNHISGGRTLLFSVGWRVGSDACRGGSTRDPKPWVRRSSDSMVQGEGRRPGS